MKALAFLLGLAALLTIPLVQACSGGQEWMKGSGMYIADVTDDNPVILPRMQMHFDFGLFNESDPAYGPNDTIPFSDILVTLSHGKDVLLQKKVAMDANRELTGIDYKFPDRNMAVTLHVRYANKDKLLAEASFPLKVGSGEALPLWIQLLIVGAAALLLILPIFAREKLIAAWKSLSARFR